MGNLLQFIQRRWRRDILVRMYAGIFLAVTISTGMYTVYVMQAIRNDAEMRLQERVERLATVLADTLARPLFDINNDAVYSVVNALATAEVVKLRVWTPDGALVAGAGAVSLGLEDTISASRAIKFKDKSHTFEVGRLELSLSRKSIREGLRWQILQTAVANLILALAIIVSVYRVGSKIARPFADIQDALEKLALGKTDIVLSGIGREDQIGRLSVAVRSFRDTLTKLRQAEQHTAALLDEKSGMLDELNAIYEGSNDAIMLLTEKGFFDCNHRTLEMFGLGSKQELVGLNTADLSPPFQADGRDSVTAASEEIATALARGQNRFEWMHRRRDGKEFPAEILLSAFVFNGKNVLQGTVRDITERKLIEQKMRDLNENLEAKIAVRTGELTNSMRTARVHQEKLQSIVDTALDAVVRLDSAGTIVGWNSQAEQIFGWSRSEALGRPLVETVIPLRFRQGHASGISRFMVSGGGLLDKRIEIFALRRDGREFPIELAITQVKLEDDKDYEFCSFIRDITERREREQSLLAANRRAEAASIAKSEFLANMSHEIRTPMSAIIGMAYLALRTELNPKQQDYVEKIHRAAQSLLGIINDILDFSKIEAGKLDFEAVSFSLDEVLGNVAGVTSQKAADKCLEYLFNIPHAVPRQLVGDPLRLGQVLINLINNAIKFTESGEVELACSLLEEKGGMARLYFSVRDTGIGMTAEQQSKLFQPFSQADGSTTRKYGGTGLGLSISQHLIHLMDGSIGVETEPGQGSVFYFYLQLPLAAPQPPPEDEGGQWPAALEGSRIMVIDDSQKVRGILADALRVLPLRVDCMDGAAQALAAIQAADATTDPYRLILIDWQMPDLDGIALARRIKSESGLLCAPHLVLMIAFGREDVQEQARAAGISGFLFKPFSQSSLRETLVSVFVPRAKPLVPLLPHGASRQQFRAAHVLLVEDNDINQQIAVELLGVVGLRVDVAVNGIEAVDKLMAAGPSGYDLVLMDLEMPKMDGHAATIAIRNIADFAKLPIIAMTAHALAEVHERCLKEGMQDYLTKPISPDHLYSVLARWLGVAVAKPPGASVPDAVPVPMLEGIDTALGLKYVAGNRGLYLQLLNGFRGAQRLSITDLRVELANGEHQDAARRVHSLRGLAGNIGALGVQQAAERLELSLGANPQDATLLSEQIQTLDKLLSVLLNSLDRHFANDAESRRPVPASAPVLKENAEAALEKLGLLLQENDVDAVDYFEEVRAECMQILGESALERLEMHLGRYEFDEAQQVLAGAG